MLGLHPSWICAISVKPVKIKVMTVGKSPDPGFRLIIQDYTRKIERYCGFQLVHLRSNPKRTSDPIVQAESESESMLRQIAPTDWVVLLDEKGREVTSPELAELIAEEGNIRSSVLVFCVGGPYGHGEKMKRRGDVKLKLSSMVLNHQVALVVLLEQIYRAWTIIRGEKYHH